MSAPATPPRDRELHRFLAAYFGYERMRHLRLVLVHALAFTAIPCAWSVFAGLPPRYSRVAAAFAVLTLAGLAIVAALERWMHRRMFRFRTVESKGATSGCPARRA